MAEGYTDFEKVANLLDELDIKYTLDSRIESSNQFILIEAYDSGPKVDGYPAFYASWEFDEDGEFIKLGLYE